ncbi:MAG: class I SAM-dependent methyltransferase [Vicingaceae bacterium]|nr:class I SAM-dependent methyltransferase [Vicingaceae bacterium]
MDKKEHWQKIYTSKQLDEVSWYQPTPETSLEQITKHAMDKNAAIIDVGGGDSFLVDNLLTLGYTNITVLDISEAAINRAKERLGEKANKVKWIVEDVTLFNPTEKYDYWHDRAVFHFLKDKKEVESYLNLVNNAVNKNGKMTIATFSENGPKKCSGIEIQQYSKESLITTFNQHFKLVESFYIDHPTPFDTTQNFVFCTFEYC